MFPLSSPPFPPDPSQGWETGKSTLLLASGDQGVGVEVCEVCGKNSLEQRAAFCSLYIKVFYLFSLKFILMCNIQDIFTYFRNSSHIGQCQCRTFCKVLTVVQAEGTLQMQCLNKNLTIPTCQPHELLVLEWCIFSVLHHHAAKVKIFDGYHVYLPMSLHSSFIGVNTGNINADHS